MWKGLPPNVHKEGGVKRRIREEESSDFFEVKQIFSNQFPLPSSHNHGSVENGCISTSNCLAKSSHFPHANGMNPEMIPSLKLTDFAPLKSYAWKMIQLPFNFRYHFFRLFSGAF